MKTTQSIFGRRAAWLGAGFALTLGLLSCTETKTKNIPTPIPPTPTAPVANEEEKDFSQYTKLVWGDEFDGPLLDQASWTCELGAGGWGNNELQTYTNSADNVFLKDGNLVIRAVRSATGGAYTSGRLITKGKQNFQYGRLDIRAKLPQGKGVWPAIWMLGSNIDQVPWPTCGEIDIMEMQGSRPNQILSTMHYGASAVNHPYTSSSWQALSAGTYADDYHTYSVVRSKDLLRVYVDGRKFFDFTAGTAAASNSAYPFNNQFFAILNVAVGGNFDGNPDASTVFPQQMNVDYVRFYQYQ